jgi:hypothetical protein
MTGAQLQERGWREIRPGILHRGNGFAWVQSDGSVDVKFRCGNCRSLDGTQGYTIGHTLCPVCRAERAERRAAYSRAQEREARAHWIGAAIAVLALLAVIAWVVL